jgi:CheY-like chemotaxis protein
MRGAGTPQGVRHEILSVGPSCADNTLHKPEVLVIAVIGGITEARNIQRWPYTHRISVIPTGSASLILVAVDDSVTRQMVVNYLEAHQMRALSAPGREAMISHLALSEPDLAILDLRLGQDNGLDLLRDIRSRTDVPVIILADERRDDIDPVVGLELGADDCVTTPFGIRELLARVRAVLRRNARRLAPPRDPARGRCRFGGWQLDRRSRPMEPIAFTVVMHSPTLKSHCRPSSSIFLARRPTPRSAEGPRAFADDCDELRIGEQSPCAVQAMGKHRLSQASTKSIILEVPNGNARARARARGKRRALLLCARNRHRWSLGSTTV